MCVFLTICFLCRLAMATTSVPGPLCLAPFCGMAWSLLKPCMFWRCFLSFSFSASADILGFCLSCGSLLLFIHGQLYVPDCLPKFLLPRSGSLIFFDSLFAILCGGCQVFLAPDYCLFMVCQLNLASLVALDVLLQDVCSFVLSSSSAPCYFGEVCCCSLISLWFRPASLCDLPFSVMVLHQIVPHLGYVILLELLFIPIFFVFFLLGELRLFVFPLLGCGFIIIFLFKKKRVQCQLIKCGHYIIIRVMLISQWFSSNVKVNNSVLERNIRIVATYYKIGTNPRSLSNFYQ